MLRRIGKRYREAIREFVASQGGSVAMLWALAMVVMMAAAGGAIDYARAVNARALIAAELDAASLAGARYLATSTNATQASVLIRDTFDQTAANALRSRAIIDDVSVDIDAQTGRISTRVTAHVQTSIIQILGIRTIPLSAQSEVSFGSKFVEVALVLDVTGSMRSDMVGLRAAAQSVVDSLIPEGTNEIDSKIRISIVPYSEGVNLGTYASTVTNGEAGWQNCATERSGAQKYTDATYDYDGAASEFFGGGSTGCAASPEMEPLTSNRAALTSAISNLTADGYTAGQTGIAWGWNALSPNWNNLWPAASAAGQYTDNELLKFAIIMTDGDFNTFYDKSTALSCDSGDSYFGTRYGSYGDSCETTGGWSEIREAAGYDNESSTRARTLCAAMKDTGIATYSIYFGDDNLSAGAKVMQDCATNADETYFVASSTGELVVAFEMIAAKIKAIYLSK